MMTLHIKTSEILFAESNSTSNNDAIGNHNAGQLRDHLRQQALQYAGQAATVARDFRETYGLKINTPFIIHAMGLASFIFITDLQQKTRQCSADIQRAEHAPSVAELKPAFEECFRCMLSAGMQHMNPRAVVRMMYRAATALNITLPDSALQMLQIVNDNSWRPLYTDDSDATQGIDEILQGGQRRYIERGQYEMEDLLKMWEEMRLQDKSNLLSGEDEAAQSSGSAETP